MKNQENGLEYNTQRQQIVLKQYGRNIQNLVYKAMEEPDRQKRLQMCYEIIEAMEIQNPKIKTIENYKQILWTHLAYISDFQLDVDYPYEIIKDLFRKENKPEKIDLIKNQIAKRQYGRIIQEMVKKLDEIEDEELRQQLIENILLQMKKTYIEWGKENVLDQTIFDDFLEMCGHKYKIPENFSLPSSQELRNKYYLQVPSKNYKRN